MPNLDRIELMAGRFSLDIIYPFGSLAKEATEYVTNALKVWINYNPGRMEKEL